MEYIVVPRKDYRGNLRALKDGNYQFDLVINSNEGLPLISITGFRVPPTGTRIILPHTRASNGMSYPLLVMSIEMEQMVTDMAREEILEDKNRKANREKESNTAT